MPAKSKKQFKYIQTIRSKYKNKKSAPKKYKWVFNKEWTKGINYKNLKESITPKFDNLYKSMINDEKEI